MPLRSGTFFLRIIFATLTMLFFLLAAATPSESALLHKIAGYEGIFCGTFFYEGVAAVVHDKVGRKIFPLV